MPLTRPVKLLVGLLTLWPILYMFLFMAFVLTTIIWSEIGRGTQHVPGFPVGMLLLFGAHLGTMLLMSALTVFYVVYLVKTERVPQDKKALWAAVIFLGNMLAMPVFFYLYVWPDHWPQASGPQAEAPARSVGMGG